ncbi:MAG: hypothetical protein E5X60_39090 [Mesorhizobium sp.]|nr:MAG: hypothetical protein E5X60_39090 [Mesorhizobium sp.]
MHVEPLATGFGTHNITHTATTNNVSRQAQISRPDSNNDVGAEGRRSLNELRSQSAQNCSCTVYNADDTAVDMITSWDEVSAGVAEEQMEESKGFGVRRMCHRGGLA